MNILEFITIILIAVIICLSVVLLASNVAIGKNGKFVKFLYFLLVFVTMIGIMLNIIISIPI